MELLAMFFSIFGAYKMSSINIFIATNSFLVSNFLLFYVSMSHGLLGLSIQLVLFSVLSLNLIYRRARDYFNLALPVTIIYFLSIYIYFQTGEFHFKLSTIDIFAATFAILGSLLMSLEFKIKYGFVLFLLADTIYIYIALQNEMYFFLLQSIFFIWSSFIGIKNFNKLSKR